MRAIQQVERLDARYLRLRRAGVKPPRIARVCGVSLATVYNGIARERAREAAERRAVAVDVRGPKLTPSFGAGCVPLAQLTCADVHPHGPIPKGSSICCMAPDCHKSGLDHLPMVRRPPKHELPAPEPAPKRQDRKQTRKARRKAAAQSQAA